MLHILRNHEISIKLVWLGLLLSGYTLNACSETIYQWSDPWGQLQYSTTPVPGATVSDLTELPETTKTTAQQKQNAMIIKLQKMKQKNIQRKLQSASRQQSKIQAIKEKNHCKQLRALKADLHTHYLWQHALIGFYFGPDYYSRLNQDLSNQIYSACR